jgi:gliding motility-associated-like protein
LIANTPFGCADTIIKDLIIRSKPLYWFPNAFTPVNSEDRNDEFGLVTPLRITEYEFTIYNRWGELIFSTNDPNKKWDGTYNGKMCVPGQYVYQASFKNPEKEIKVYKGTVNLLK